MTLKVALPNKGSLSEAATAILREAGYRQRNDVRDLIFIDPENDLEFYYLRPRDIAIYVGSGELQIGITAAICSLIPLLRRTRSLVWILEKVPSDSQPQPNTPMKLKLQVNELRPHIPES
jgi:hypothetical protein